jgi:putative membrane protein
MLAELDANTGPGFDHMYADQQVIAHRRAAALMQGFAENGPPGPIRDAAAETLPTVQHHLGDAMTLAQQLATT